MQASIAGRWWALGALAVALLAFGLDVTVLNVALPTLAVDLHASTSQLQWFANAYTLVLAAGLLPAGLLGDKLGQKRLLLAALTVFGLASVACAYAGTAEMLIVARAVLGLGGAFLVPLSMSVLIHLFPASERGRAIAVWSAAIAVGIPLGPVLGGWLLQNFWWGSVFLINVPLVLVAIAALVRLLPDIPGAAGIRIDLLGILLSSGGLVALTYGLVQAGDSGWGSATTLAPLLAGTALIAAFGGWLRRGAHPLVDVDLFGSRGFVWGAVLATVASFGLMGSMFVLPQLFQAVDGSDPLGTGLRLVPLVGGLVVGVQVAERARSALGAKIVVAAGFVIMAVGFVIGSYTGVSDGYGFIVVWVSSIGLGLGFSLPPAMDVAMGSLSSQHAGAGSGLLQAMRQVGGTVGVAIVGTVLNAGYRSGVDVTGLPGLTADAARASAASGVHVAETANMPALLNSVRTAFVHGMSGSLWLSAIAAAMGCVLTLAFLPRLPQDVAEAESAHDHIAG